VENQERTIKRGQKRRQSREDNQERTIKSGQSREDNQERTSKRGQREDNQESTTERTIKRAQQRGQSREDKRDDNQERTKEGTNERTIKSGQSRDTGNISCNCFRVSRSTVAVNLDSFGILSELEKASLKYVISGRNMFEGLAVFAPLVTLVVLLV
jgi:hypothetical protein